MMRALAVAATLLLLAGAAHGEEPFLVKDIDTTGEPVFEWCEDVCTPGPGFYGGLPNQLVRWRDRLFFVASDRVHGFEPWVSDGTPAGTRMVADICPGPCDSAATLLGPAAEALLFWAIGDGACRLWRTDGDDVAPVGPVSDPALGRWCRSWPTAPSATATFGDHLFFHAPTDGRVVLYRSDGTAAGTEPVVPLCTEQPCVSFLRETEVTARGLFIIAWHPSSGAGLWRVPTPKAGAIRLAKTCSDAGFFGGLTSLGDEVLFTASCLDAASAPEQALHLFSTDGSVEGTRLVREFGQFGGTEPSAPSSLEALDGLAFLTVQQAGRTRIWRTDGTAAGTMEADDIDFEGALTGDFLPFVPAGGRLLFAAVPEGTETMVLHAVDADGVEELPASSVGNLTSIRGQAFFAASVPAQGRELWTSDGTAAGTGLLAEVAPGTMSSSPEELTALGGLLLFAATTPELDTELWAIELTEEPPPPPPDPPFAQWIEPAAFPSFRFQVRITAPGAGGIEGQEELDCQPETVCVSGHLAGRSEVFLRIMGPRPNGFLWPTIVRFTPSLVEVWVEETASGEVRYYRLEAVGPADEDLSGRQDRRGFLP